ncbi:MAG: PucR family transcriptional regulator ligand-binding domain-containing protein [Eubacteriales bacterium]|nr:PucR family transcriptional regulator ligand-binding domain-containing protein [Eubacteriales bacterium]
MSLTVRELLKIQSQLADQPEMLLSAGAEGLDNEIRGVTIIEAPDIVKFIQGGELLLTGLYAFKTCSLEEFSTFIDALYEKQVSAIYLKRGREVDYAREKISLLQDYCNKFQIPLVDLPFQVSFQVILSLVMERIFESEVTRLKYYQMTNDNFCALSLNSEETSINQILDMLEKLIRNPVAVFDSNDQCLYFSNANYQEAGEFNRLKNLNPQMVSRNRFFLVEGEPNRYRIDLRLASGKSLYLLVWEVQSKFSSMDMVAIENGIVALQYEFSRQYAIFELEQKFHNDLIENLLTGKLSSHDELERSRVFTGLCPECCYRVISFALVDSQESRDHFDERLKRTNLLKQVVAKSMPKALVHYTIDRVSLIQQVDPDQSLKDYRVWFQNYYDLLSHDLQEQAPDALLQAGIGRMVRGLHNLKYSYQESDDALVAVSLAQVTDLISADGWLFFSDLGIFKLLSKLETQEELMEFVPEGLLLLYKSESKQRAELVQTLECYLDNQLNLAQTAKDLFIHYKTAMYRLNRIKEITGLDFGNATEVLSVRIGMIVYQMIEGRQKAGDFLA